MKITRNNPIVKREATFEQVIKLFCGELPQKRKLSLAGLKRFIKINRLIVSQDSFLRYVHTAKGV